MLRQEEEEAAEEEAVEDEAVEDEAWEVRDEAQALQEEELTGAVIQ
jgi:hypothetical protein